MKKILFGAAALTILFAASCKKKDDNNSPSNGWTLNGTSYNATIATGVLGNLAASDASGNHAGFAFGTSGAPAAGTYKVVSSTPAATEVLVTAGVAGSSDGYISTGNDNVSVTVTSNNGKITVSAPSLWVKSLNTPTDSVKFSGNITQTQ